VAKERRKSENWLEGRLPMVIARQCATQHVQLRWRYRWVCAPQSSWTLCSLVNLPRLLCCRHSSEMLYRELNSQTPFTSSNDNCGAVCLGRTQHVHVQLRWRYRWVCAPQSSWTLCSLVSLPRLLCCRHSSEILYRESNSQTPFTTKSYRAFPCAR
jgi:hypothetical protein